MIDKRVVRRYAAALFAQAQAMEKIDLVESDLGLIAYSLESIPTLAKALFSPMIPPAKKHEIVDLVFSNKVHDLTLNYLHLLIDKRREELIRHTEPEYIRLANEARGITLARVTSAVELTDAEVSRLRARLSAHTGHHIDLQLEIDQSIIAGAVVRLGDTVLDGSVAGFLDRLKEQLLTRQSK